MADAVVSSTLNSLVQHLRVLESTILSRAPKPYAAMTAHLPKLIFLPLPLTHFAAAPLAPLLFLKQAGVCHRAFALASPPSRMLFFPQAFLGFIPSLHAGLLRRHPW